MQMVQFKIKATPKASKTQIEGYSEGMLRIRIKATPQKGEANAMIIVYFSDLFDIPKSNIHIESGKTSRIKRISIEGISQEVFDETIRREVQKKK